MNRIFSIILIFITFQSFSQNPNYIKWEKTYGNSNLEILVNTLQTSDGGFILYGTRYPVPEFYIVKTDSTGSLLWEKTYGGSHSDGIQSIIENPIGRYMVIGGTVSNDGDIQSGNHGSGDFWLLTLDEEGKILREKTYGGSDSESLTAAMGRQSLHSTSDGGYLMTGNTLSNDGDVQSGNKGDYDIWLVKINNSGNILWEKTYGGSNKETLFFSKIIENDNIILGTISESDDGDIQSGNKGKTDIWIFKTDSKGNILWEKTYGGSKNEILKDIHSESDGGFILSGRTYSNDGDINSENNGEEYIWLVKIDSIGEIQWEKTYGDSNKEFLNKIEKTKDGGYILLAKTFSNEEDMLSENAKGLDVWVVKIDSIGEIQWEKTYGGSNYENCGLIHFTENGYLIGGISESNDGDIQSGNRGKGDAWLFEINFEGKILWEKTYGGSGREGLNQVLKISNDSYLLSGRTGSNDGDIRSDFKGGWDYWIVRIGHDSPPSDINLNNDSISENNSKRTFVSTISTEDDYKDTHTYSLVSGEGDVDNISFTISGDSLFTNEVIDIEKKMSYLIRLQTQDTLGNIYSKVFTIIITKAVEVGNNDHLNNNTFKIYPNPVNDELIIETNNLKPLVFTLYDVLGNQIFKKELTDIKTTINLKDVKRGMYFIKLLDDNDVVHQQKIVKY